jgi:uncharacterized protein YhaN
MKLCYLHLIAFGCFTNARLDFAEEGPNFHVIYGENEAGKSTALRALTGMLYGIPAKTPDAFLHQTKDLRIAAELERVDGKHMTFVRRKGNRDTLLDPDGKPLPEAVLLEFLGGANEEIYTTMFRLDHGSLVRGGEDLLAGKGDLAESLFEAGTGITGLRQALAGLEAEVEQLFKPRSSTALVNRAIDAYEEARKRSRDLAVLPKQWSEQSETLKRKEQELKQLKLHISELRAKKERISRFRLALPHVTRRKDLLTELNALGEPPLLPASATRDREEAERRKREASSRKDQATSKLDKYSQALGQLQLPDGLLTQANAIASAYERLESYRQAIRDLPTISAKQLQSETDARTLLSKINSALALEEAGTLQLTTIQRTRVQTLTNRHPTLQERLRNAKERAESIHHDLKQMQQEVGQMASPPGTGELERAIERARKQGDLEASFSDAMSALRTVENQALTEVQRLTLWSGSLEQLETLPVPLPETVEHFESELDALRNEQHLLNAHRDENNQRTTTLEGEIRALRLGGAVPTETELQQAREHRDHGWQLIRRAWHEGAPVSDRDAAFDPEWPLADAYEKSVADADAIADRLRREADRVAKLSSILAEQEGCRHRANQLKTQQADLTARLEAWHQRWREPWQPAGIAPLSPKEMRAWLTRQVALVAEAREVRESRRVVKQMQKLIAEHAQELSQALVELGEPGHGNSETLSALLQRSQACLQRFKDTAQQRTNLENETKRLAVEHDKAVRERDKAQRDLEAWQADWDQAITPLGLRSDTSVEEVKAVLETLDALFKTLDESTDLRSRAENMQRHIDQFNTDVAALVRSFAPELKRLQPDLAANQLQALLTKAQQDAVRRQSIEKQIEDEQKALQAADREISDANNELQALMKKAHCSDLVALDDAERKSALSRELSRQLEEVNKTLAEFTAGATLEAFLDEVAEVNADQLPFQIDEFERQTRELDDQRSQLEQHVGRERAALQAMDGSEQAALAAEEAQSALAAVRAHADRYLRLRFASEILRRHIERYREQNQDPVIKRASEIFPRLTLNSFDRLKTGFDEKDRPVLLGVRSSGEEVEVSGMSDGTRDQLFLALRLASLERQLASGEPLPFVVDDVLIKFDDDRAEATLGQLADLAERTQVLFFTHHSHLVEMAQKVLPGKLLRIHRLDKR